MTLAERIGARERPVVVQFHAPWCGPCKALHPLVERLETEFAGRVDVVRIDVDAEPGLAREAKVRGVPTLVAFRDGAEIRRHAGALSLEALRTFFRSALGEIPATAPVGAPAWHLAAKVGGAAALLVLAGQIPSLDWIRWVGLGVLFWAMRDLCPACRTAA